MIEYVQSIEQTTMTVHPYIQVEEGYRIFGTRGTLDRTDEDTRKRFPSPQTTASFSELLI